MRVGRGIRASSLWLRQPWSLALQNLAQDRLRLALSVVGVALPVMLILFILGFREGVLRSTLVYLDHAPGSVAVMPQGVKSTSAGSGQFLSSDAIAAVRATDGVARVTPVLQVMAIPDLHGRKEIIKLIGYDAATGGGPWNLYRGREPRADGEVVLDRALAARHNFKIGDAFEISAHRLTVVGLSNQTNSWTGSFVFADKAFVESLALAPKGGATFLIVTPVAGTTPDQLMARLHLLPASSVLLKSQLMANDERIVAGIFDQVLMFMAGAAFIVGVLVIGMVIYSATTERRGEYGIVKAIGAGNGVLYRVVAAQAVAAAGGGVLLGVGLAFAMGWLVTTARPQFNVAIEPTAILATLAAGLVMSLAGALAPARSVAGLAPADVFRR